MAFLIPLLALVAGVELGSFWLWSCYWSKRQYFFFSLQAFLSKVSLLPAHNELTGFGTESGRGFLTGLLRGCYMGETYDLASVEYAGLLPYRQYWSILRRIDGSCRLVFALASIAFLTSFSQLLCSCHCYSIRAFIDSLRPSRKNRIRSNSSGAPSLTNSWRMDWRCSKWETH